MYPDHSSDRYIICDTIKMTACGNNNSMFDGVCKMLHDEFQKVAPIPSKH